LSRPTRLGCIGVSVVTGLLLLTLLQSSLAWASGTPGPAATGARAGRWLLPASPTAPNILITKTVGTASGVCATATSLAVPAGSTVTYCYKIQNNGTVTLTNHTLVDDRLGTLLNNFPFILSPGVTAFLTESAAITQSTLNTAVWTAVNPDLLVTVTDSAQASVTAIPLSVVLSKTVGLDSSVCASSTGLSLPPGGGLVYYCYTIKNTGPVTMTQHDLVDDQVGLLLNNFPYNLAPGASAFLTEGVTITATTINVATWTVRSLYTVLSTASTDSVRVSIYRDLFLPFINR
jgi:uncharacterized repeat protein (TIGR01451 family)